MVNSSSKSLIRNLRQASRIQTRVDEHDRGIGDQPGVPPEVFDADDAEAEKGQQGKGEGGHDERILLARLISLGQVLNQMATLSQATFHRVPRGCSLTYG